MNLRITGFTAGCTPLFSSFLWFLFWTHGILTMHVQQPCYEDGCLNIFFPRMYRGENYCETVL